MAFTWVSGRVWVLGLSVLACSPSSTSGDDDDDDGGKASCTGFCNALEDASCQDFDHGDCVGFCASYADMQKDTNRCDVEFETMLDCFDGLTDICQAITVDPDTGKLVACNSDYEDFAKCFADYCADHSAESYCN